MSQGSCHRDSSVNRSNVFNQVSPVYLPLESRDYRKKTNKSVLMKCNQTEVSMNVMCM